MREETEFSEEEKLVTLPGSSISTSVELIFKILKLTPWDINPKHLIKINTKQQGSNLKNPSTPILSQEYINILLIVSLLHDS